MPRTRLGTAFAIATVVSVSAAYSQTTSLDRELKAAPRREVRVGIYAACAPNARLIRCRRSASPLRPNMAPCRGRYDRTNARHRHQAFGLVILLGQCLDLHRYGLD